jgi:hypothetical protein
MPTMTNNDTNQPAPADQDWFGGRRWTGIGAVGVVILVALCVVIVVVINHHGGSSKPNAGSVAPSTTSSPTSTAASSTPGVVLPTTAPTSAPVGATWTIYQTLGLPSLAGVGPSTTLGAIATGYQHSPVGALLATVNEGLRYELAPDSQWRAAAAAMLAPGPGTDAWIALRAKNLYGPGGAAGTDTLLQIAGFQFVSYTPTDAVIQIVAGDTNNGYQVGAEHATWNGSDWKFVPAADGGPEANVQQVSTLDGFIAWRGV